jgi:hypothetical protein
MEAALTLLVSGEVEVEGQRGAVGAVLGYRSPVAIVDAKDQEYRSTPRMRLTFVPPNA